MIELDEPSIPQKKKLNWRKYLCGGYRFFADPIWIPVFTALLVIVGALQYCVLQRTDTALQKVSIAANDADKLNAVGLRPWVSSPKPVIMSDLTQDRNGILHLTLQHDLKNTGHSPALNALYLATAVPLNIEHGHEMPSNLGKPTPGIDPAAELRKFCEDQSEPTSPFGRIGNLMFPNQSGDPATIDINAPNTRFEDLRKGAPSTLITFMYILTCARYRSTIDNDVHVTAVLYVLARPSRGLVGQHDPVAHRQMPHPLSSFSAGKRSAWGQQHPPPSELIRPPVRPSRGRRCREAERHGDAMRSERERSRGGRASRYTPMGRSQACLSIR
jgi:hypothetical protein